MNVRVLTSKDELDRSKSIWKQVSEYCTVFNLQEWFGNWWDCYGSDKELRVFIAENDAAETLAILPMMKYQKGNNTYLTQLAESGTDYFSVILKDSDGKAVDEIIRYIKNNENYDRFIISNLKSDEKNTELLIKSAMITYNDVEIITQGKIFFVDCTGDYDSYIKERSKNFRHKYNQLKKIENKYDFEVVESYSEDIVENIIKLHKKRWLDEMQLSVFFDKRRVDFMHSILKDYAKLGYLRLFLLKDGERIVSYRVGFVFRNVYYDWNTAFDLEYASDSIGIILCNHVIEYCFGHEIREFDFLRGEEDYKRKFSTGIRHYRAIEFKTNKELEDYVFVPPRQKIRDSISHVNRIIWTMSGASDEFDYLSKIASTKNIDVQLCSNGEVEQDIKNDKSSEMMVIGDRPEVVMELADKCNAISCLCINEQSFVANVVKPNIVVTDINEVIYLINEL